MQALYALYAHVPRQQLRTMVGRIFFPPSSSKKYFAAAFSTG